MANEFSLLSDQYQLKEYIKTYYPNEDISELAYRYYQKAGAPVRFPFGYGLSYTGFSYSDLKIEERHVTAKITNTGNLAGAEVVQLYVAAPQDSLYRPIRELKGFARVSLQPGESREVSFDLDDRSFAVWADGWKVPGGVYKIELGASSEDIRLSAELSVEGEDVSVPAWQKESWYEAPYGLPSDSDFEMLFGGPIQPEPEIKKGSFTMEMSSMEMKDFSLVMNSMFKSTEKTIAQGFGGKVDYNDPAFKMMVMSGADAPLRAAVVSSGGALPANVAEGLVALANGHPIAGLKNLGSKPEKKPEEDKTKGKRKGLKLPETRKKETGKVSLLHNALFMTLMKNRQFYNAKNPKDYETIRKQEDASSKMIKIPRSVAVKQKALGGVSAEWIVGKTNPTDRIVLYIHGGGFVTGSSLARRSFTIHIADKIGLNIASLDYRLAPEHPFPQGAEDCLAAYRALLKKYSPDKIVLLGESAGGNLVLSLLLQIKAAGLGLPAATFALSPTVQYDQVLDSYRENLDTDCMVTNLSDEVCDVYLCSRGEAVQKNPIAAPYYGDYSGCTPVILWVSDSEVLRDDSLLLFEKLKEENVTSKLYMRSGLMHTWLVIPFLRESKKDLLVLKKDLYEAMNGTLAGADEIIRVG